MKKLTIKQEKFCQEYVSNGGNATEAYCAAYSTKNMKQKTIWEKSSRLRADSKVGARISDLRKKIEEESKVSAVWVRKRLIELVDRCMQVEVVLDGEGMPTGEYRFDSSGANKAIDTLNRMQGYYEKDNKREVTISLESTILNDLDSKS